MQVLFIGGVFDDCHNSEIISKTKTYVEYAANNFQRKIIEGLSDNGVNLQIISAPFLGAYPFAYSDAIFRGFDKNVEDKSGYKYVSFINVWGIRNFSRKKAVIHEMDSFINSDDPQKLIIVYTPHTPFIEAACYAKRRNSAIKICLVIPDLPQYMNLADNVSQIYKIAKKWDVQRFMKYSKMADSFVVLTEHMKEPLEIGNKPYIVIEGIYEPFKHKEKKSSDCTTIVYTGKLDRSFGIMNLISAFSSIEDKQIRLVICGSGEEKENVEKAAIIDKRIEYMGQVSSNEARRHIVEGDILVNPRQNNSEYTKYSFPSKLIDYLSTGNSVIAYKLDGIPEKYKEFVLFVPDDSVDTLAETISYAIQEPSDKRNDRSKLAVDYLEKNLSKKKVGESILKLNGIEI